MNRNSRVILEKIVDQIRNTSIRFELVMTLFGTDENLAIINKSAPNVFLTIHNALMESVVIGLRRLGDPAKDSRNNKNLSIECLKESLQVADDTLEGELSRLNKKIRTELKKLDKFRSKRIAHNDLKTHMKELHKSINSQAIDTCLRLLQEYVNKISLFYDNTSMNFLNPSYPLRDGPKRLLSLLSEANSD